MNCVACGNPVKPQPLCNWLPGNLLIHCNCCEDHFKKLDRLRQEAAKQFDVKENEIGPPCQNDSILFRRPAGRVDVVTEARIT